MKMPWMMKVAGVGALIAIAVAVTPAISQVRQNGELTGIAADEKGEALPGVSVTLTGSKLLQGRLTIITGEKGAFRFSNLNPGEYELEFSLSGFNIQKINQIRVSLGQTAFVRATLVQAKINQEIQVIAATPIIDLKSAQISTNYSTLAVEKLPTGRNLLDLMETVAGINDRGAYGAGGNADSAYYKGSSTSAYMLNGVDVSDLNSGATWVNPNYDTIEEIQVIGIGAPAEFGNYTGAALNVITKKGSNAFHGGLSLYYSGNALRGDNSGTVLDLKPQDIQYHPEISGYVGGPLLKEKLFFFVAGGYTTMKSKKYGDPAYATLRQPHIQARLDWLPHARHTLSFMINSDPLDDDNLGLKPGSGPEIGFSRRFRSTALSGNWLWTMSDKTLLDVRYAGFIGRDATDPVSPGTVSILDRSANRTYGSSGLIINDERTRHQVNAAVTHYADDFLGATHEFKFGVEYERSTANQNTDATGPNGSIFGIAPVGPMFMAYAFEGYHIHSQARVDRASGFVQDNVQVGSNLNLSLGIRYDHSELSSPGQAGKIVSFNNLSPRLGLTYDLTGNGTGILRAHFGRYFDKTVTQGFLYAFPGLGVVNLYATFFFQPFNPTPENIASLTATVLQPKNLLSKLAAGKVIPVDPSIHSPYTDVFSFGFEKQIFRDFVLSFDYIYKRDHDPVVIQDRSQHVYNQVEYTDPYLGNVLTLWNQTDRVPGDWYYTNSSWAYKRHHLAMLTIRKKETSRWSLMSSIVYQDSQGNTDNVEGPVSYQWGLDTDPNYYLNPLMIGKLTYDRTWQFKLLSSYTLPWNFQISGDFRILSGLAWAPNINSIGIAGIYREKPFIMPLEQRGSRRFPTSVTLNLRLSKSFPLSETSRLELLADVFNLLNRKDGLAFYEQPYAIYPLSKEKAFGLPASLVQPISARLGARWMF